ncbi:MAG: HlyD family type I secretion periplasmic adaptor subunit, partial [Rhizobiales bacterium]|nr:HlyD family type I secretion periplasmic adaptor subunit [Hyphomicrobiales bacterium]
MKKTKEKSKNFSPAPYITAGYVTIFLGFGIFGTWAATAPLASGVVAPGTLSVESNRKTIQHLEGGIISEILAKEGEVVNAGDILVKLDPTQAQGNYTVMQTRMTLLQATEARLLAESVDASEIKWPDDLNNNKDDVSVQAAIKLQQTLFQDRKRTKDGQTAILNARIDQLNEAVKGLDQQLAAVSKQMTSMQGEIERLTSGQEKGVIGKNQLSQMTRGLVEIEGKHGEITAEIAKLRQTISETQLQIVQIRQEFVERAGGELRDIRDQLAEVTERRNVAKDILSRTVVRAPVRGMIQNIRIHTTHGVIRSAEPILDIIPLDDNLIVNAKIRPIDIDSVHVGLDAEVRFSSFSARTTPAIFGKVTVL